MAEIPGATITFTDYSGGGPRLLNVPDVHGNVTVQDAWDTLSAEAAKLENLIYKKLIDRPRSGGKQELQAGVKFAGIVMTMYNTQIKFFDQVGPSTIRKKVLDGVPTANDAVEPSPTLIEAVAISTFTFAETEKDISAGLIGGEDSIADAVWAKATATQTDETTMGGFIVSLPKRITNIVVAIKKVFG